MRHGLRASRCRDSEFLPSLREIPFLHNPAQVLACARLAQHHNTARNGASYGPHLHWR